MIAQTEQGWEAELPAEAASVPQIRGGVSEFARRNGAGDSVVASVALAVTEAVTNAIVHGFVGLPAGRITASARAGDGVLVVCIVDDGRGMTPRTDSPGLGLGLPMIGQLTSSCDIREAVGGRGTEVRMTFTAPGVTGPAPIEADEGDDRVQLLAQVADLADGGGWPAEGVERLVELLVPEVADAAAIDVVDQNGEPSRLAASVAGDRTEELSRWLAARRPRQELIDAAVAALRSGDWMLLEIDTDVLKAMTHDERDAQLMTDTGAHWWLNLPLGAGDTLLGSLGLGFRLERGHPAEQRAFLEALAERVARGLANTHLVADLRRTRQRLERVLDALTEAVTVSDAQGHIRYANAAAVELFGATSVEEVLTTRAEEIAGRFDVTLEDGSPVTIGDLPGRRVLAGGDGSPVITRSLDRRSGRVRWLRTRATRLDEDTPLAVNIIEDVTEAFERWRGAAGGG